MNGILVKPCNDVNDAYWVPTLKLNYIVNDVQENQQHQLDTPGNSTKVQTIVES